MPHMSDLTEAQWLDRFQWWSLVQLMDTRETVTPVSLAQIVSNYLRHGAPRSESLTVEVLVDY